MMVDDAPAAGVRSPYCPGEMDNTGNEPGRRAALVVGEAASFHAVTEKICGVAEARRPPQAWYIAFGDGDAVSEHSGGDDPVSDLHGRGRVGDEPAEHVGV